jgi:hypothetical protein
LVSQALELASIPTVVVGTMRVPLQGLPRVLITGHHRGLNFGAPKDSDEHIRIARAAVKLLMEAHEPTLHDLSS